METEQLTAREKEALANGELLPEQWDAIMAGIVDIPINQARDEAIKEMEEG